MRLAFLICLLFLSTPVLHAQLMINEISQGTGSQEYVEFVVMGTPTCSTPVPTVDLRGVVIDDNNGYFASGSGQGIATGALRFANIAFWSAIPQGTMIVVYNNSDPNPSLPADDISVTDGNCMLVIPANSILIEGEGSSPTSSDPSYPAASNWVAGGGSWSFVAMANSSDSFQIRPSISSAAPSYSVSWGSNTNNTQIVFASAGGNVFSFTNATSNDPLVQANWAPGAVATDQTPGLPNNAANSSWIASMNPECFGNPITITLTAVNSSCGGNCSGSVSSSVSGGTSPYTYSWNTGATTPNIFNQCPDIYTLTVTDSQGCTHAESATVGSNGSLTASATTTNESCSGTCDGNALGSATGGTAPYIYSWSNSVNTANNPNLCPGTYTLTVTDQNACTDIINVTIGAGATAPSSAFSDPGTHLLSDGTVLIPTNYPGTWTSQCGSCMASNGVFDPSVSGTGTFEVCFTTSSGSCTSTSCDSITITNGCTDVESNLFFTVCGNTITVNGTNYTAAGSYNQVITLSSGCDSTIHILITACVDTTFSLEIPNVMTPNNDQVNDIWIPSYSGLKIESGWITNRWGNIVKTLSESDNSWNGKVEDNEASDGVYFYELTFTDAANKSIIKQGFIQLYR